jgi:outer membrane immunogenic protein
MRKILYGAIAWLACSGFMPAMAADLPVKAPPKPVPQITPFTWTGFYAGINGGAGWGRAAEQFSDQTSATVAPVSVTGGGAGVTHLSGAFGGVQAGYNWQMQSLVYGLEADFQGSTQRGSLGLCDQPGCLPGLVFLATGANYRLPWFATVRGRLGYTPLPSTLLYLTGGLAVGRIEEDFSEGPVGGAAILGVDTGTTRTGWTFGGGVESAITDHWTAKVEYLYVDYGTVTSSFSGVTGGVLVGGPPFVFMPNTTASIFSTRLTDNLLRAGLNYKF